MALSEFDIINRFFTSKKSTQGESIILGPGDDCAIIKPKANQEICISTDTLISGVHFPEKAPPDVVAHRSLAANLSDLAAMGAEPLGFTLALTLAEVDESWLEKFSTYLESMAQTHHCPLIGGNLSRGSLSLTLQVIGVVPDGKALKRSGAKTGDDLYVSGCLGDAACGLKMLKDEADIAGYLKDRYCYPQPRLKLGFGLRDFASSAIDISDGLISDAEHICQQSCKGVSILLSSIPLSPELVKEVGEETASILALTGGDDYELCFTAPRKHRQNLESKFDVTIIGEVIEGERVILTDDSGNPLNMDLKGYDHFNAINVCPR